MVAVWMTSMMLAALPAETPAPMVGGVPLLITHGDTVKKVADLPEDRKEMVRMATGEADLVVGYRYSYFGIFWLDLWTWGGKFCLSRDLNVLELDEEQFQLLIGKPTSDYSPPWLYRFPLGLILVVGFGTFVGVSGFLAQRAEAKAAKHLAMLREDHRYRQAMEIFETTRQNANIPDGQTVDEMDGARSARIDAGLEAAVDHLVQNGIEYEEALSNFNKLLTALLLEEAEAEERAAQQQALAAQNTLSEDDTLPEATDEKDSRSKS